MTTDYIFIGHDFFGKRIEKKKEYRRIIGDIFNGFNELNNTMYVPIYGDTEVKDNREFFNRVRELDLPYDPASFWVNITTRIKACKYGVYDLTGRKQKLLRKEYCNYNVLLESGVSVGREITSAFLIPKGWELDKNISNLKGHMIREYKTFEEFRVQLEHILGSFWAGTQDFG